MALAIALFIYSQKRSGARYEHDKWKKRKPQRSEQRLPRRKSAKGADDLTTDLH